MRTRNKVLLVVEVVVCFAPVTVLWALGAYVTLMVIAPAVATPVDLAYWNGLAVLLGFVGSGLCGLAAIVRVLRRLLGTQRPLAHPWLVLAGASVGILSVLPLLTFGAIPSILMALLPVAATAHVLYLSRRILFPRSAREGLLT